MSDKLIRIPKNRHALYIEASKIQRQLKLNGYNRPIFDIMNELTLEKPKSKDKNKLRGWSI